MSHIIVYYSAYTTNLGIAIHYLYTTFGYYITCYVTYIILLMLYHLYYNVYYMP